LDARLLAAAAGFVFAAGTAALAHHAFSAEFDANRPLVLTGIVTKTEWVNPHAWIWMDVKDANGTVVNWGVEMGPPNALLRRGWNRSSMPVGSQIVVDGYGAKNGRSVINAIDITFPDGKKIFAGSSGTGAPREGTGVPR
jgi:hypothetical protein